MAFHDPADDDRIPVFRVMDESGMLREGVEGFGEDREDVTNMYTTMLRIHQLDTIFYEAQRQGRISFYMTANGEESIHVGAALGFNNDDPVYAQYREAGLLLMRGFTLQQFADQCCSNEDDGGKGRQMPVHYGSPEHHFYTISSPLTTQLPQAAGTGYAMKMEGKGRCCAVFFGEGAASEGDFHAGMNFASTLEAPVVFFCRNNGLRRFMESKGWWDDEREKAANKAERKAVLQALTAAEKKPAPDMSELFSDVYAGEQPWHLAEQEVALRKHMARHPEHYAGEGH
ncbi:bkdA [Symbiodinium sp. KB8]|nr:bkdA [Symbiodinium sp. KB8]